jgi:hypothetical protein
MQVLDFDLARRSILHKLGFADEKSVFLLNGYPAVYAGKKIAYVHRLVAEKLLGISLTRRVFVHHKDEDRGNFLPTNLESCSHGEHNGLHRRIGTMNHFYGKSHSQATKDKISAGVEQRPRDISGRFVIGADLCS